MPAASSHVLLRAFVDEVARCGATDAVTSPGSRNTPILLALAAEPAITARSVVDERAGGFLALGLAKATGRPVVVTCTSGTAVANLAPAVVEAHEAGVPLVVLTADRPAELREVGAGQAIDQIKAFGSAVRWFVELELPPVADPGQVRWVRSLACRAAWTAAGSGGRPGPVHVNVPLREPLVPPDDLPEPAPGRADRRPWLRRSAFVAAAGERDVDALAEAVATTPRGVVVCGRAERGQPALAATVARFAAHAAWPLLADPLSGARRGSMAAASYDALLRDERFAAEHAPDLVLRVGDLPTSKPLRGWLAGLGDARQIAFAPEAVWHDPAGVLEQVLDAAPGRTLDAVAGRMDPRADTRWAEAWREADERAGAAIDRALGEELSEPSAARALGERLPDDATLFVASSMPIRDVESFWPTRPSPPRVLGHRGANGIDGTVSAAFGVAAAGQGPTALLIGDVALAHDLGGLLAGHRLGLPLTIVVLHNDGGGIFEFLPVSGQGAAYVEHVATPHGLDVGAVAGLVGARHERPATLDAFAAAVAGGLASDGITLIEVRSDRAHNRALHERVWEAVGAALG